LRGFKMAGVRYLMLSLWEVPDNETAEFMDSFYGNWLGGMEIRKAFQATQQQIRDNYKTDPSKWAAFVLVE
jgi:CHAT domain-containing protein